MKVATDYDREVSFANYQTYAILQNDIKDKNTELVFNQLNRSRIEKALERNLESHGLSWSENPDMLVTYSLGANVKSNYSTSATHMDMGGPWRGRYLSGGGMGSTQSTTHEYNTVEGQLMVSLIDAQTNKLLWYSAVSNEITGNGKKAEKMINDVMVKIFESFPYDQIATIADIDEEPIL